VASCCKGLCPVALLPIQNYVVSGLAYLIGVASSVEPAAGKLKGYRQSWRCTNAGSTSRHYEISNVNVTGKRGM